MGVLIRAFIVIIFTFVCTGIFRTYVSWANHSVFAARPEVLWFHIFALLFAAIAVKFTTSK